MGVEHAIAERAELDALLRTLDESRPSMVSAPPQPVLTHRDVQPRNVLIDKSGRLTALLDFESSAGGEPAEDFKTIALDWHTPGFAAFSRGYRDAGAPSMRISWNASPTTSCTGCLAVFSYLGSFAPWFLATAPVRFGATKIRRSAP